MDARIKYSVLLIGLGLLVAFLPFNTTESFQLKPDDLLLKASSDEMYVSVDQAAQYMNNEDSTVQFIDLRSAGQFRECNIPGAINIPYADLLNPLWEGTINRKEVKNIFYGNDDQIAGYAWAITTGLGYKNSYIMKGGLNEWYKTVMLTRFSGQSITPSENALFGNRLNARKTFTQINSLPDSMKSRFFIAKRVTQSKLDGGCE